jgi:hypothetical protein
MNPLMVVALVLALPDDPPANPIDAYYAREALSPADDYDFFRRLTLDLTGRLPLPDDIRAFAADPRPDKRERAIDAMLAGDAHADFFADLWLRALVNYELNELDPFRMSFSGFRRWLVDAIKQDLPYDQFARRLVAAAGDSYENGAVNYAMKHVRAGEPPIDMTDRTVQVFLGIPIQCAQCHNHPYEDYTREQYWGIAGFFQDTRANTRKTYTGVKYGLKDKPGSKPIPIPAAPAGSVAVPRFLDGRAPLEGRTLRESLAEFIVTAPDRQFARNFVNRTWAHFMGWGFFTPLDGFGKTAQRRDDALLESLTAAFEQGGGSMRALIRAIVSSRAYQLACTAPNAEQIKPIKPMSVPQLLNVMVYTYNLEPFINLFYAAFVASIKDFPEQYKTKDVFRMYLYQYVTDLMTAQRTPGDELKTPGSVRLALRFMNNEDMTGAMYFQGSPYMKILKKTKDPALRVEEMFLATLGRPPDATEQERFLKHLTDGKNSAAANQDVYWVLVNTSEFFFIH